MGGARVGVYTVPENAWVAGIERLSSQTIPAPAITAGTSQDTNVKSAHDMAFVLRATARIHPPALIAIHQPA